MPLEWVFEYLTEARRDITPGLQWVLMFDYTTHLEASRRNIARRLYIYTVGRDDHRLWPAVATLMDNIGLSRQTVVDSLAELEQEGWIVVRRTPGRKSTYYLSWPAEDPMAVSRDQPVQCATETKTGGRCERRAGWGTATPGEGPCVRHGGKPKIEPVQPVDTQEGNAEGFEEPHTGLSSRPHRSNQ
jgi:hypothetical protein